ncbi:B12-binding domain-containing radical SAM protein [Thermodesulfobacteriota bacterium]
MRIALLLPRFDGPSFMTDLEPINLGYLAAFIEQHSSHDVQLRIQPQRARDREFIDGLDFDLIGLSVYSANLRASRMLTGIVKSKNRKVVIGGPLPTGMPMIVSETGADFAVIGEGEHTFLDLLQWLEHPDRDLKTLPGLAYEDEEGRLVTTKPRPRIGNMDSLPFPRRDFVPSLRQNSMQTTFVFGSRGVCVVPLYFSRGCLFSCPYCLSSKQWSRNWQSRSPENLLAEMDRLASERNTRHFMFLDADTNGNPAKSEALYDILTRRNYQWMCETSPVYLSREILDLMQRAGCRGIFLGLESGVGKTQEWIGKGLDGAVSMTATLENIAYMEKLGIKCTAAFLIGLPGDSKRTLRENRAYVRKVKATMCWFSYAHPYPGTTLYQIALERGWIAPDDPLERLGSTASPSIPTEYLTVSELKRQFWVTSLTFFLGFHFLSNMLRIIRRNPVNLVMFLSIGFLIIRLTTGGFINRLRSVLDSSRHS